MVLMGHSVHNGRRAVQIVAPRSISANVQSRERPRGRSFSATSHDDRSETPSFAEGRRQMIRDNTLWMLVSTTGTSLWKAKHAIAFAEYLPIPGSVRRESGSSGIFPPRSRTTTRASFCNLNARALYPRPDHARMTLLVRARARDRSVGKRCRNSLYFWTTRLTCVCCSMISEARIL